jgi:glycosyltransferase involved in cell wall biosynthesis
LHPIGFEEPFGLSVVESMMCGTPVIAFKRGSMNQLIIDGITGFLVYDLDGAIRAVSQLSAIRRKNCRAHALRNFSRMVMASRYLELYMRLVPFPK